MSTAAFANDTLEISTGSENYHGDKLDIVVSGSDANTLMGMAKLNCKDEGDQTVVSIEGSETDQCKINLKNGIGAIVIVINICGLPPTIEVTSSFGGSCDDQTIASGGKELNLAIKVL